MIDALKNGGERQTEDGATVARPTGRDPEFPAVPQRDDPPFSKFNFSDHLFVVRRNGLFVLSEMVAGQVSELVRAPSAQMILNFVRGARPEATHVEWIIVPERTVKPFMMRTAP